MIEIDTEAKVKDLTAELGLLIAQLQQVETQRTQLVQEIQYRQDIIRWLRSLK